MKKLPGKIILIDDDRYEKSLLELALYRKELKARLEYFDNGEDALEYLKKTKDALFLIICDMNMPKMNGIELKRKIDADPALRKKAIPFIFISNSANANEIEEAYDYRLQGYFKKPYVVEQQSEMLEIIIKYWSVSLRPVRERHTHTHYN